VEPKWNKCVQILRLHKPLLSNVALTSTAADDVAILTREANAATTDSPQAAYDGDHEKGRQSFVAHQQQKIDVQPGHNHTSQTSAWLTINKSTDDQRSQGGVGKVVREVGITGEENAFPRWLQKQASAGTAEGEEVKNFGNPCWYAKSCRPLYRMNKAINQHIYICW
jgi:hypothetical protein